MYKKKKKKKIFSDIPKAAIWSYLKKFYSQNNAKPRVSCREVSDKNLEILKEKRLVQRNDSRLRF